MQSLARARWCAWFSIAGLAAVQPMQAQGTGAVSGVSVSAVPSIGGDAEDLERIEQLRGTSAAQGWLIRTPSSLLRRSHPAAAAGWWPCRSQFSAVAPVVDFAWNSRLPFARNDGAMWAGRGSSVSAMAGAEWRCNRVTVRVAPEIWYARNLEFPVIAAASAERSGLSSPWYAGQQSADLPQRFGSRALFVVGPGQSAVEVDAGHMIVGLSSESQWWGPGIRNALVMSNNAAGIPHFFIATKRPLESRFGQIEARWMVGSLSESPYFDLDASNDLRSLSGLVVTFRPALDTTLTLGAARVVLAPIPGLGALPARFLDPIGRWGEGANVRNATFGRAADQLTSLFARALFPSSGIEVYGEWARVILPASFRSLFVAPQFSQGFTLGAQWVTSSNPFDPAWRGQVEFTMLEQPYIDRTLPPPTFYVSPTVPQGYTQRGQVIGASIGPGSSSQWIALDHLRNHWHVGALAGRIRWNNDQFYRELTGFSIFAQDVSVFAGIRGGWQNRLVSTSVELIAEKRMNYLFQNIYQGFDVDRTYDVSNLSLRLTFTPLARR